MRIFSEILFSLGPIFEHKKQWSVILHAIQRKKVFPTLKKQAEDVERIDSVSVKYMQSIVHLILFLYKIHLIFF